MAENNNKQPQVTGDKVSRPYKGLHKDFSPADQPEGTYPFALNAVNNSNRLGREKGSFPNAALTLGYTPIGKVYIGDGQTVIFSVLNDVSEIGIVDSQGNYTVSVNDSLSIVKHKLNFKLTNQIQAVYRLRRGCEKTIYFVFKDSRPLFFNFNKPEIFQNNDDTWNVSLFHLQKHHDRIPKFEEISVLDTGGNLEPGGYNVAVQYVDESLNPTEWMLTSEVINIYNDSLSEEYREIDGSINSDTDYNNYPRTDKAIRVDLSNLDPNFTFYRLAFIEATSGTGQITNVRYTEVIPKEKTYFIYTGDNFLTTGTEEEILAVADIVEEARSIEQIQNMLLLGNTSGKKFNYCGLQRYASKIKADCFLRTNNLNNVEAPSNPKNPVHRTKDVSYMPGEVYSFAVVFIFDDLTEAPAVHIPGKSPSIAADTVFDPETDSDGKVLTFGMALNNESESTYVEDGSCPNTSLWGMDSEGIPLRGKKIRHHRFPLRSEIGQKLVTSRLGTEIDLNHYQLLLSVQGNLITPIVCDPEDENCTSTEAFPFEIRIDYRHQGDLHNFTESINPYEYAFGETSFDLSLTQNSPYHSTNDFTDIKISITDINGEFHLISATPNATYNNEHGTYFNGAATVKVTTETSISTVQDKTYQTEMFGIKFSGIEIPSEKEIGAKIIGYYIVRNERTEFDKTILDTGILVPSVTNDKYISHGLLNPETDKLSDSVYGLIHPEHKFHDRKYTNFDIMLQEGNFKVKQVEYGKIQYDDVFDGSSYEDWQKEKNDDGQPATKEAYTGGYDGFSLNVLSRDAIVDYESKTDFTFIKDDFEEKFYLAALDSRSINGGANDVYNISTDNQVGIVQLKEDKSISRQNNLPYVILKKNNVDSYSNFRVLPYYKDSRNIVYFNADTGEGENVKVFGGDTYVVPMRYVNTMFWDNRIAKREGKTKAWNIIIGAVIIAIAAVLAIFTAGGSLALVGVGAALVAAGGGVLLVSSGIKQANLNKAYGREYDKGLRETVLDNWVSTFYQYKANVGDYFPIPWGKDVQHAGKHAKDGPTDDTIQWIGDCITDLWFETSINTGIRTRMVTEIPNFLGAPGKIESGQNAPIPLWEYFKTYYEYSNMERYPISSLENHLARKLLVFNPERNDSQEYIGVALGEYYHINPDYERENTQKIFMHLPLEYDCCSDCQERFPHRWRWSEQSFQEELSDNYRILLPNNYRDLEGETGEITNMFSIGEKLFIHTREGLWEVPKNYQERVTDQVVSFLGTGSYFDIPPRKVIDDITGNSAGLQHKWSATKTDQGYFFVCESQKKIFEFNGQNLKPISEIGISRWFQNNLEITLDRDFKKLTDKDYAFKDNPSNPFGTGFIIGYDANLKKLLVTKKDYVLSDVIMEAQDFQITIFNGQFIIFNNYQNIIDQHILDGYVYLGIIDGQMKFSREEIITKTVISYEWVPPITTTTPTYYITYFRGYWEEDDPRHGPPGGVGGWVEFKSYPSGSIIRQEFIYVTDCTRIQNIEIVDTFGVHRDCQPEEKIGGDIIILVEGYYVTIETQIDVLNTVYKTIDGVVITEPIENDKSWTLSYSLDRTKESYWISWHSYLPNFYMNVTDRLFSWMKKTITRKKKFKEGNEPFSQKKSNTEGGKDLPIANHIWEHNVGEFNNYYGKQADFIIEIVSLSNPLVNQITNHLKFNTEALKFNPLTQENYEERLITFNKAIVYNDTQCSGLLELKVKNESGDEIDFMHNQIINNETTTIDRQEDDWFINDLRDIRVNYKDSIWNSNINEVQKNYYIDKVLNVSSLDPDKSWEQLESFRGKYLIIRLIFDKFVDVNLLTNFIIENETLSNGN